MYLASLKNPDNETEEYSEAVDAPITDMTVKSRGYYSTPVSKGSIEHEGKNIRVSHKLKDI